MKFITAILISLLMISICYANEYSIGIVPICKHLNQSGANETTNGVFLSYNKWIGGTFNNSNNVQSYFLGRTFTKNLNLFDNDIYTKLNLHLGLLYGYNSIVGGAPTFEIGYGNYSIETMFNPVAGGVISFMFKYNWR